MTYSIIIPVAGEVLNEVLNNPNILEPIINNLESVNMFLEPVKIISTPFEKYLISEIIKDTISTCDGFTIQCIDNSNTIKINFNNIEYISSIDRFAELYGNFEEVFKENVSLKHFIEYIIYLTDPDIVDTSFNIYSNDSSLEILRSKLVLKNV